MHLLAEEQPDLCQHFAIPDQPADEQLDPIAYQTDRNDTPILDDAPAVLYCKWHEAFDAGDHTIIVGKVVRLEQRGEAPPILYYDQDYRTVTSADASTT